MSNRKWITDRLPTAADADEDGDVTVQNRPKAEPSDAPYFEWELVLPGMAWCHTDIWEQENEPVPAPKPALAVGQRWRRRDGNEACHESIPNAYRLVTKEDGNGKLVYVLQGYFTWAEGRSRHGGEWRDLETQDWLTARDDIPFGPLP